MLWVGKVGLKVGLKWPSSATGPSPFSSMGPSAGQVKTKTWTNFQIGLSVLCCRYKVHPYYMPAKQDTNPSNNGQVKFIEPV